MKATILAAFFALAPLCVAPAQETSRYDFSVGAGFTTALGDTGRYVNNGWNLGAGFGYNFSSYFGAVLDLNYNSMGLTGAQLFNYGVSNGGLHVFSATVDPIVHLTPKLPVDVYVTGGGGLYRRAEAYSVPTLTAPPAYNPFFGFAPSGLVDYYSSVKPGIDAGIGLAFASKWKGKFFVEARYNRIIANYHTDYLPVTIGYRW